jgi:hypothetical protein
MQLETVERNLWRSISVAVFIQKHHPLALEERCRRRILYDFKAIEDLSPALTLAAAIGISESDDESDDSQAWGGVLRG